jgi:diguanylate cyclase (GGDEF)-like protein/putative nucleotidyltransferase with HDIG domain
VLFIILSGVSIAVYSVSDLVEHPVGLPWLILVALTVVSGWATLRIPAMPISFSISDTFNIAASLLFGPSAGAINAALDGLVLSSRMASTRRSIDRVLFNMAAPTIALWIASQVFFALGGNRPLGGSLSALRLLALLTLLGTLDFSLNSGIVAIAVSFERRQPILSIWREHLASVWITYFGGTFGAMLLMVLARFGTVDTLILILPLPVILYVTFRHALGRAQDQISHLGTVNRVYVAAIEALAHAVDAKDEVTHDHTRRVQDQTVLLARALAVEDEGEIQAIQAAALLHDVGKLASPEHILNKPGRLTPAEYDIMKRHAPIGADILSVIGFPYAVAPIVRHHHENWDGTGYPDGLVGDRIPRGSRIVAVVDCFDALTSDRPYRPRMEDRDALQILSDRRGTMYDPQIVDAFFAMHGHGMVTTPGQSPAFANAVPAPVRQAAAGPGEGREDLELQTFFALGRAVSQATSISQLGEILWIHLRKHLPASVFVLYGYDGVNDTIAALYTAGHGASGVDETPILVGDRLSGWVAATAQTVMNSDARLDLDEPAREHSPLRSALAVPIISNGRTAAVLSFYAEASNAFDDADRRIVEAVGRAVAGSLPSLAQSSARLRSTSHRLSCLLSRLTGRKAVCEAIVRCAARAVSAQIAAVAVVDASDRHLSIAATHGYPLSLVEHVRIEPGEGILGSVLQSGRVMHVRNVLTLPPPHRSRPRYRTSSFVAVPIRASREILGVICVTDRGDNRPFTHKDVSTLRGLAAPAALALGRECALLQAEAYAHAAAVDPLSGAFNRRHFHVRLEEELQRSQRHEIQLTLLMIDIDDFKSVNDSFGHLAGDAIIKDMADIMRRSVRVFDVCARFGGEEFAIIMPGSGAASAMSVAERIRERIESFHPSDRTLEGLTVTASLGLAVSSPGISAREIIGRADQALYLAKRAGKNRVREYEQTGTS